MPWTLQSGCSRAQELYAKHMQDCAPLGATQADTAVLIIAACKVCYLETSLQVHTDYHNDVPAHKLQAGIYMCSQDCHTILNASKAYLTLGLHHSQLLAPLGYIWPFCRLISTHHLQGESETDLKEEVRPGNMLSQQTCWACPCSLWLSTR